MPGSCVQHAEAEKGAGRGQGVLACKPVKNFHLKKEASSIPASRPCLPSKGAMPCLPPPRSL